MELKATARPETLKTNFHSSDRNCKKSAVKHSIEKPVLFSGICLQYSVQDCACYWKEKYPKITDYINTNFQPDVFWNEHSIQFVFSYPSLSMFPTKVNLILFSALIKFNISGCLHPACIYLFKFNNGSTWAMCKVCSKLTIKTPEQRHWPLNM